MPPKKSKSKNVKVEKKESEILKEGVSNVEIKLYESKYKSIEKIITRLKANNLIRKNNIDKYNRKTENLDNKLKDEYEHAKTMLDEKFLLKKKLNAEVEELQRELYAMDEIMKKELKIMDDEFLKDVRKIKSVTAVHVGRNNKLEEFSKQEKMLEQKYTNMVEQIGIMVEKYELEVKKYIEKEDNNKQFIQKKMLKRSENFAVDIKKQSLLDNDLLFDMEINKLYDINNKLKFSEEMKIIFQQKLFSEKEEIQKLLDLNNSIQQYNDAVSNDLLKKKSDAKVLKNELKNMLINISDLQQNLNDEKPQEEQLQKSLNAFARALNVLDKINRTQKHKVLVDQYQLNDIRNYIVSLNETISRMEDDLFGIYQVAMDHLEKMKSNTSDSNEEKLLDFIGILNNKLNEVIFCPTESNLTD